MDLELRQYITVALRWWWLIVLSIAAASIISYVVSARQPRVYQTSTTLMVGQFTQAANPASQDFFTAQQLAQSYAQIVRRQPVLQAVVDSLGLEMDWQTLKWQVYAQQTPGTQLLVISVLDNSPERAVIIADEIARQLILQSPTSPENQSRQERSHFVQDQLDDLENRIAANQAKITALETELDTALSARRIQDLQTEITNLEKLINSWQANYAELLRFLEGGNVPNYLTIIEPAQWPGAPISPDIQLNVLLAAAGGLILAAAGIVLMEYLDDTIKRPTDLTKASGVATIGDISRIQGKEYSDKLIVNTDPFSPVVEDYRMMRGNLQFAEMRSPTRTILVTSPNPEAGKSTTASNLAVIMAHSEVKTIIIDSDLRRPILHEIFDVPNPAGLTELLMMPELNIDGHLKDTAIPNLQIITSGALPPNPSELLNSARMTQLLAALSKIADLILLDSPPMLAVSDAMALVNKADGVILVARAERTRRSDIKKTVKQLTHVRGHILGGVLNGTKQRRRSSYYYYYNPHVLIKSKSN